MKDQHVLEGSPQCQPSLYSNRYDVAAYLGDNVRGENVDVNRNMWQTAADNRYTFFKPSITISHPQ